MHGAQAAGVSAGASNADVPPTPAGPALAAARSLPQPVRNGPANDRRGRSSEES